VRRGTAMTSPQVVRDFLSAKLGDLERRHRRGATGGAGKCKRLAERAGFEPAPPRAKPPRSEGIGELELAAVGGLSRKLARNDFGQPGAVGHSMALGRPELFLTDAFARTRPWIFHGPTRRERVILYGTAVYSDKMRDAAEA
jgi:hypothetical protein